MMTNVKKFTYDREVELVGQRKATLIEHQVDDGEVELLLLEVSDQILI